MSDASISVNFRASTSDLEAGVTAAREALASLAAPIGEVNSRYVDALRAAQEALSGQMRLTQEALRDQLRGYADDARNHRLSEDEKLQASRVAIQQSVALELDLEAQRAALGQTTLAERQRIANQIVQIETNQERALAALDREALDSRTRAFEQLGTTVTRAFNSQLTGLLSGTESWGDAVRKTLGRLVVSFIESSEATVVQWAAGEAAKTSATAAGTASRGALQAAGNSALLATQGASIIKSILSSAAEAFAGVFGFLAPVMGPFAAGPAAAAQATVAGAAGAVASADIGMWSVPADMLTLVHHNELIMPAAEAGAFRDMLSQAPTPGGGGGGVSISPTAHFHVNAIDGASVAQWMRSNSPQMMRAMDEAVRHGAHLALRRLSAT